MNSHVALANHAAGAVAAEMWGFVIEQSHNAIWHHPKAGALHRIVLIHSLYDRPHCLGHVVLVKVFLLRLGNIIKLLNPT